MDIVEPKISGHSIVSDRFFRGLNMNIPSVKEHGMAR